MRQKPIEYTKASYLEGITLILRCLETIDFIRCGASRGEKEERREVILLMPIHNVMLLHTAHRVTLVSRFSCSSRCPGETMSVRGLLRLITAPSTPAWTISSSLQGVWQACSPINCSCSSLVWTKHYHHPLLHCTAPLAVSFTSRETFLQFLQ